MIVNRRHFRVSFPSVPLPVADVWRTIVSCLEREKCLPKQFYFSQIAGHEESYHSEKRLRLNFNEIESLIRERDLSGFRVNTWHTQTSVDYSLTHQKNEGSQSVVSCRIENKSKAPDDWTRLIEAMMIQWPTIGGWQWDSLYYRWQNSGIPSSYIENYGEIPPLMRTYLIKANDNIGNDRLMLDSATNTGRSHEILPGVFFAPTAEMWLGPHFWQYAKCTKEEALAADFFLEKRDTPHFLYLKSWPVPFSRPDGEQGRQQQRIWKLLFHEDCEWPPGSGGISDIPI